MESAAQRVQPPCCTAESVQHGPRPHGTLTFGAAPPAHRDGNAAAATDGGWPRPDGRRASAVRHSASPHGSAPGGPAHSSGSGSTRTEVWHLRNGTTPNAARHTPEGVYKRRTAPLHPRDAPGSKGRSSDRPLSFLVLWDPPLSHLTGRNGRPRPRQRYEKKRMRNEAPPVRQTSFRIVYLTGAYPGNYRTKSSSRYFGSGQIWSSTISSSLSIW